MKAFFILLLFTLWGFLFTQTATAVSNQEQGRIFADANAFFHQANTTDDTKQARQLYEKALLRYEQLARDIRNGKLYYNIGNTYIALGDVGRAIVNYRRAEKLLPGDENLARNLNYVLTKCKDNIPIRQDRKLLQTIFFWHYAMTQNMRFMFFCGLYLLFWVAAGLTFYTRIPLSRWVPGSLLLLNLVFATSLLLDHFSQQTIVSGVVVAPEIIARQGDGNHYQASFTAPLHAGTEFQLLEKRADWLHVALNDGRNCWLPLQSSELIQ